MTTRAHQHASHADDRGVILPLVLVFVVVLAVIVAAVASYTTTSLRTSDIADQSVSRLSAAESGMQFALEDASSSPMSCTGTPVVRPPLNGANISTTCWRVPELENLDGLFALILTGEGPGGSPVTQLAIEVNGANSDNGVKNISGPVYFASPGGSNLSMSLTNARAVLPDPDLPGVSVAGIVKYEPDSGTCPDPTTAYSPADWTGTPSLPPVVTCDGREWEDLVDDLDYSDPAFATSVTTAAPLPNTTDPLCHVYEPGLYATPPILSAPSFFKSGIYHFASGRFNINRKTVIGKRTGGNYPDAIAGQLDPGCAPHWNSAADDSGAVLIFGANARVFTQNNSKLSVYGRDVGDLGSPVQTESRAVVALSADQAIRANAAGLPGVVGVTLPINGPVSPVPDKLIDRANGGNTSISFYGQVYAPHSWVDTGNAASAVLVEFLGGIVAGRLTLKTAANVDGFVISVPTSIINAFYIESVATTTGSLSNKTSTVRTRSVQEDGATPPDRVLSVDSWRICERSSC